MNTSCQPKGLGLLDGAATRFIRFACCLRLGGWVRAFRQCLFSEVLETLDVKEGFASAEAALYRRRAVSMFAGVGPRKRLVQTLMAALPNGDWRLRDCA